MPSRPTLVIGISGTPGTGKKSAGKRLAELLHCEFIDLNELAIRERAVLTKDNTGIVVEPRRLRGALLKKIRSGAFVVSGHLLPYVLKRNEVSKVVVLRCSPSELKRRYAERGYNKTKSSENLVCEVLDICLAEALKKFGTDRVVEFDTTARSPDETAITLARHIRGRTKLPANVARWLLEVDKDSDLVVLLGGKLAPIHIDTD